MFDNASQLGAVVLIVLGAAVLTLSWLLARVNDLERKVGRLVEWEEKRRVEAALARPPTVAIEDAEREKAPWWATSQW